MRSYIRIIAGLQIVLLLAAGSLLAQTLPSFDNGHDIMQLYSEAETAFDLGVEDAVILLDSRRITVGADGRVQQRVHRIIWINEDRGITGYGDHRIAYDSDRTDMTVHALRTWRDDRWWDTGPTGKVETLPFALDEAYDYTNLREMMLLHDGIELPCILEVVYSISDMETFRQGFEYLWLFAKDDPVMLSEIEVRLPAGTTLNVSANSEAEYDRQSSEGMDIHTWSMGPLAALPYPLPNDAASFAPCVQLSTWESWEQLGEFVSSSITRNAGLNDAITSELDSILRDSRGEIETASLIAQFVNDKTKFVDYDAHFFWTMDRQAERTYETSYGSTLDRAILASSLFRYAGFTAGQILYGPESILRDLDSPSLFRFDKIGVSVEGADFSAVYDASSSSLSFGDLHQMGRSAWIAGEGSKPSSTSSDSDRPSSLKIILNLNYSPDDTLLTGNGALHTTGCFSPYEEITGLSNRCSEFLGDLVGSVLKGAVIEDYNLAMLEPRAVSVGFEISVPLPSPDDFDRIALAVQEPSTGLLSMLADDVDLYSQKRGAPVVLADSMVEELVVRFHGEDIDVIQLPSHVRLINGAGTFVTEVGQSEDEISLTRRVSLNRRLYSQADWQELRKLLLEYERDGNQVIYLSEESDSSDDAK